jgi:hypothetical protein
MPRAAIASPMTYSRSIGPRAGALRRYWAANGHFPFDERMMKVLTDPASSFPARREAASNLGNLGYEGKKPIAAAAKFTNPTVAEAILAALDRDTGIEEYEERSYIDVLARLGDRRIVTEVARRAGAANTLCLRRKYALAGPHAGQEMHLDQRPDRRGDEGQYGPDVLDGDRADGLGLRRLASTLCQPADGPQRLPPVGR